MENVMCIYKIINTANNKFYIGSTVHAKRRKLEHFGKLKNGNHPNPYLQSSFNKYGTSTFKFEIIEIINDESMLLQREQYWLDVTAACDRKIGYNINKLATGGGLYAEDNPMYGVSPCDRMDEGTYAKWLASRQGKNASKPMLGRHHTEESKAKMSISRTGKYKHSDEWKRRHSELLKGKKLTDEQKRHISEAKLAAESKNDVKVICIETEKVYCTLSEAARQMSVSRTAIFNAITGKSKTCQKLHWAYA